MISFVAYICICVISSASHFIAGWGRIFNYLIIGCDPVEEV